MGEPVRLFGRIHPHRGPVAAIRVRVQSRVLAGAVVRVTDLQLQPGDHITGWTLHPADLGVQGVTGWEWRNGVVSGSRIAVVAADVAAASPTVWDVRGATTAAQVGQYHLGAIASAARVDGEAHAATQGAGVPPHLTARSDVDVPVTIGGRALVCCWFRGLAIAANPEVLPPAPTHVDGPLTTAHPSWGTVLAAHATWAEACTAHPTWS